MAKEYKIKTLKTVTSSDKNAISNYEVVFGYKFLHDENRVYFQLFLVTKILL